MTEVFAQPDLGLDDLAVIENIHRIRAELAAFLSAPRRWTGGLRRTAQARAIQGSNSIEGYTITDQDAAAAVEDEPPLSADEQTWAEILGYRRVLTYVLSLSAEPGFEIDQSVIRSMHFMLLEHELAKLPGRYRPGPIYVHDDRADRNVYEGPEPHQVPPLMMALVRALADPSGDVLVRAAMAHLNLVMIHPFKDGNGRVARALQTMVLARDKVLEPTFSSIEEWLGHNTDDCYTVLAAIGGGAWHPERDARLWVQFNLRAHHMQAQTLQRRVREAEGTWHALDALLAEHGLPDRTAEALFDASLGLRVTRPAYAKRTEIEDRTATRDLARLVGLELLMSHGQTRARFYTAGRLLAQQFPARRSERARLIEPYPGLAAEIRAAAAKVR